MSFDSLAVTRRVPTLLIGSGYAPIGYALAKGECLIVEEGELCDAHFYLPLRQFSYEPYSPTTSLGGELSSELSRPSLLRDGMRNTCGFQCALCSFLKTHPIEILLKCRVCEVTRAEDGYFVTLITNSGLEKIFAERMLDTREGADALPEYLTVLLLEEEGFSPERVQNAFSGALIEPAFYEGRWALHLPVPHGTELNHLKGEVYRTLCECDPHAKLLYIAPRPYAVPVGEGDACSVLFDGRYKNPIEALEAGIRYAGRRNGK